LKVNTEPNQHDVLMTIQNSKRPDQLIYVVRDHATGGFRTEGLKGFFGVKEIRIEFQEMMQFVPEFGEVLSFLLETMSAAKELNLPYAYENEFNYRNFHFTLHADGDYRVLHRVT